MTKILFHYPGPFYEILNTGEKSRPKNIHDAFRTLGFEVVAIVGNRREREEKFRMARRFLNEFRFIYSENSTLPLALTEPDHIPRFPCVDYNLFRLAKKRGIPIGVFYRDIYWKFPSFIKSVSKLKYFLSLPFYWSEIRLYANTATTVFVPSREFATYLPLIQPAKIMELPPGGPDHAVEPKNVKLPLRLIYVGSAKPPIYDLSNLFVSLSKFPSDQLLCDLVTREAEWNAISSFYSVPTNVHVHHVDGQQLQQFLETAHISLHYFNPNQYRRIAQPLKLYEAIAFGLPMITTEGTSAARIIRENKFGWITDYQKNSCSALLKHLLSNPHEVEEKAKYVRRHRHQHGWEARARKAIEVLTHER